MAETHSLNRTKVQGTELRVGRLRLKLVAHEGHEARQLPETDDPEEPQEPQDPRRCTISLSTREGQDDVNGRDHENRAGTKTSSVG